MTPPRRPSAKPRKARTYLVFEWMLADEFQEGIEQRAALTGGTLVKVREVLTPARRKTK